MSLFCQTCLWFFVFGVSLNFRFVLVNLNPILSQRTHPTIFFTANRVPQSLLPKTPDGPLGPVTWSFAGRPWRHGVVLNRFGFDPMVAGGQLVQLGGGFKYFFMFTLIYLGKIPILTHIFQRAWNHQLVQGFLKRTHTTPWKMNGWVPQSHWGGWKTIMFHSN